MVQHMASRWQQWIALSMTSSCDVWSVVTVFLYLTRQGFLGPEVDRLLSFPGVYPVYLGFR